MKCVAVLQSNYLPWRGYFDIINDADVFIFYDEVQFTKNDWRNRNKIYSKQGLSWITLPCGYATDKKISEVEIQSHVPWQKNHWNMIKNAYSKSPYFKLYEDFFEDIYINRKWRTLSALNQQLVRHISTEFLHIDTVFEDSSIYGSEGSGHAKLLSLLKNTNCTKYISGPAAKDYICADDYANADIEIVWKDYSGYPEYKQQKEVFESQVSILDLLFNVGPDAPYYIWGWREHNESC